MAHLPLLFNTVAQRCEETSDQFVSRIATLGEMIKAVDECVKDTGEVACDKTYPFLLLSALAVPVLSSAQESVTWK